MKMAFLVPYTPDNGPRDKIFAWVNERITTFFPSSNVYLGDGGPAKTYNRSRAINDAYSQIQDEEVVVINDADTVWNPSTIVAGWEKSVWAGEGRLVIPYHRYHKMSRSFSESLISKSPSTILVDTSNDESVSVNPDVYHAPPVSGVVMMMASGFPGFDERFVGWGEEDVAFVIKMGPPLRLDSDVYHIWHPKGLEYKQPNYNANQKLLKKEYL